MKKFVFLLMILCVSFASRTVQAQGEFDPSNPILEDLSEEEIAAWAEKDLDDWKAVMGEDLEMWNPIQMEFYKQIRIMALTPEEKQKFVDMEFTDWIVRFDDKQPDEWEIHQMLFFSAVQDLKAGM